MLRTFLPLFLLLGLLADLGCGRRRGGGGGDDDDDDDDDDVVFGDGDADSDGDVDGDCQPTDEDCDGDCVSIATDPENCGGCGISCLAGQACINGRCGISCAPLTSCGGVCVDTMTDLDHCGECDNACGPTEDCLGGQCEGTVIADDEIRLVGGANAREGRVEILYNAQWGTVCDDGDEGLGQDAQVVCRQLGLSGGAGFCCATYGQGVGTIWMDDLLCTGAEARLQDCAFGGWGVHNCSHGEDWGVVCDP